MTQSDSEKRVLITGASGFLGRHILRRLPGALQIVAAYQNNPVEQRPGVTALRLDLADKNAVMAALLTIRPHIVLHTAISREPELFDPVIVHGSANLAASAASINARFIHVSSDVIFDGTAESYSEVDRPAPEPDIGERDVLSPYGRAKARAEEVVRAEHPHPVIVRTSLIYGFTPLDHSTSWLVSGLQKGERVSLFTDQIRCPVYAPDLAESLIELLNHTYTGVINLVGPSALSRYEFGLLLCQTLNLDPSLIQAVPSPPDAPWPKRLILTDYIARDLLFSRHRSPSEVCQRARSSVL